MTDVGPALRNVVGHLWKSWEGKVYVCDRHVDGRGFWVTSIDVPEDVTPADAARWRRLVPEHAMKSTFSDLGPAAPGQVVRAAAAAAAMTAAPAAQPVHEPVTPPRPEPPAIPKAAEAPPAKTGLLL